jgi:hypothetical protein
MSKPLKIVLYGVFIWLIPFIASFPFVDAHGNYRIPETSFKSIMVVVGSFVGVFFAVRYFSKVDVGHVSEGIVIGIVWLLINLMLDLALVYVGFFKMTPNQYFTDIGLRYLSIPIYTIGLSYALKGQKQVMEKPEPKPDLPFPVLK